MRKSTTYLIRDFIPDYIKPVPALPVDSGDEQRLTNEIEQCAGHVDCQQDAEYLQDRQRLLVETLQVEQSYPEQFLGCGVIGDEVYGERGLRDAVDDAAVESDAVEQ